MFKRIFAKILGKSDGIPEEKKEDQKPAPWKEKAEKIFGSISDGLKTTKDEFVTMRERSKDLRQSNYEIGMMHLEKGNLSDAIFRFRFIKKFWPDLFDAQYQLAYCLVLKKKPLEAKKVLEELLLKNPNYDQKAKDLLNNLNSSR